MKCLFNEHLEILKVSKSISIKLNLLQPIINYFHSTTSFPIIKVRDSLTKPRNNSMLLLGKFFLAFDNYITTLKTPVYQSFMLLKIFLILSSDKSV
jgi:hypothetical protein